MKERYDLVVVGGGPAGICAAVSAYHSGISDILIVERGDEAGGILNQCIHHGFGVQRYGSELTGPEYAARLIKELDMTGVEVALRSTVMQISSDKTLTVIGPDCGVKRINAGAIVLACGCRERTREAITLPGSRCAGIYTAGTSQYLINIRGFMPGKRVVILGSGDIGLIMARRFVYEGAKVIAVVEMNRFPGGLTRNIAQCLDDLDIPLLLSTTVTKIIGAGRVKGVELANVRQNGSVDENSKRVVECDTLVLSVGLIPEADLLKGTGAEICDGTGGPVISDDFETTSEGIFACGNVAYVHNLVDVVSEQAERAGKAAAHYLAGNGIGGGASVQRGAGIAMVAPQKLRAGKESYTISYRVKLPTEKGRLVIRGSNGKILKDIRKNYQKPSLIDTVCIDKTALKDTEEITVELRAEG